MTVLSLTEKEIVKRVNSISQDQINRIIDREFMDLMREEVHEAAARVFTTDKGKKVIEAAVFKAMKEFLKDDCDSDIKDMIQEAFYDTGALYDISREIATKLSKIKLADLK